MQSQWTFVSNHALVLASLHNHPDARQRDIAEAVGITRGAVQRILHDLAQSGHISVERIGRRNQYRIHESASLRHPRVEQAVVGDLLTALLVDNRPGVEQSSSAQPGVGLSSDQAA